MIERGAYDELGPYDGGVPVMHLFHVCPIPMSHTSINRTSMLAIHVCELSCQYIPLSTPRDVCNTLHWTTKVSDALLGFVLFC